jgi:hypothetical protein
MIHRAADVLEFRVEPASSRFGGSESAQERIGTLAVSDPSGFVISF